jgi:hypothetical protein
LEKVRPGFEMGRRSGCSFADPQASEKKCSAEGMALHF